MSGSAERHVVTVSDFGLGIDRRPGGVTVDPRAAADIVNYTITPGRKLVRRPVCRKLPGSLSAQTQGGLVWNGKLYTVAPVGTSVSHTLSGVTVETLFFDVPPGCTQTWKLLDMQGTPAGVVALIEHEANSLIAPRRTFLHVWDDQRPTFVWDHACPTTWSPALPEGLYGVEQPANGYKHFRQVMTVIGGRVFLSRADGNVAFSAVNRPRVWSTRSVDDILQHGEWWYWIGTASAETFDRILPIEHPDLVQDQRYAAYVLEYFDQTTRRWMQCEEKLPLTGGYQYRIYPEMNPWEPSKLAVRLQIRFPSADGVVFRFRTFLRPPMKALSGLYITPQRDVVGGVIEHETGSVNLISFKAPSITLPAVFHLLTCPHPSAPIPVPVVQPGPPGSMPLNGQQRFWSLVLARILQGPSDTYLFTLTGTVSTNAGQTQVTGTGTQFLSEVSIGDVITVADERRTVKFVMSDTVLEVEAPFSTTYTGVGLRDPSYEYASDIGTGNEWFAQRAAWIAQQVAGHDDAGVIGTASYYTAGVVPVALADMTDLLFVQYPSRIQIWRVDSVENIALVSQHADAIFSAESQAVLIDGMLAGITSRGIKLFAPDGNQKNYVKVLAACDKLRGLQQPPYAVLGWWATRRVLLACARQQGGQPISFFALHHYPDEGISAWTRWVVQGLTSVDALQEHDSDLLVFRGQEVWRFEHADPAQWLDEQGEFESRYISLPCDFNQSQYFKKLLRCDVSQTGMCRVNIFVNPSEADPAVLGPPTISGMTHGRQRLPLMALASTVSFEILTGGPNAHEFDELVLEYTIKGR